MSADHIYRLNRPLFSFPEEHPARRFLIAFMKCQRECVGREIGYKDEEQLAVDQEWFSSRDLRTWTFSSFAYQYLSYAIELDGWLTSAMSPTEEEIATLERLPHYRCLMSECKERCVADNNAAVMHMVQQVEHVIDLWDTCIKERWRMIGYEAQQMGTGPATGPHSSE
jgi:hypothetical protein